MSSKALRELGAVAQMVERSLSMREGAVKHYVNSTAD